MFGGRCGEATDQGQGLDIGKWLIFCERVYFLENTSQRICSQARMGTRNIKLLKVGISGSRTGGVGTVGSQSFQCGDRDSPPVPAVNSDHEPLCMKSCTRHC